MKKQFRIDRIALKKCPHCKREIEIIVYSKKKRRGRRSNEDEWRRKREIKAKNTK